jgi:hypothetical protein
MKQRPPATRTDLFWWTQLICRPRSHRTAIRHHGQNTSIVLVFLFHNPGRVNMQVLYVIPSTARLFQTERVTDQYTVGIASKFKAWEFGTKHPGRCRNSPNWSLHCSEPSLTVSPWRSFQKLDRKVRFAVAQPLSLGQYMMVNLCRHKKTPLSLGQ